MEEESLVLDLDVSPQEDEIRKLIFKVRPTWTEENLHLKKIDCGLINQMWRTWHGEDKDDVVAVKVYGTENNNIFDRAKELRLMGKLNQKKISPPLYARFNNGFVYKYMPGSCLTPQQLFDPKVSRLVIDKMHQIHTFESEEHQEDIGPFFIKQITEGWNSLKKTITENPQFKENFDLEEFDKDIEDLPAAIDALNAQFPMVFCHMDMHVLNIVYDEKEGMMSTVDWEVAGMTNEIIEISRHFIIDPDARVYDAGIMIAHEREYIEFFVRTYLETHPKFGQVEAVTQELVDKWVKGTYISMFTTLLTTMMWSLIQSALRTDHDFMGISVKWNEMLKLLREVIKKDFSD